MTVSVAIATYNRAPMVRQAVEAALAQSWTPYEVVVSDDASTDGTAAVLAELAAADPRVRVIRQSVNIGGARNANAAMMAARGDLIAWCSDDDRFLPGHVAAAVEYLSRHPEIGFVHSGFVDAVETPGERLLEPRPLRAARPLRVGRSNLLRYLNRYYDWPFHPSTIVMRREVWERVGPFDPAYQLTDSDWFVRAALEYSCALLPRHGVLNRRHPGNWSNRMGSARMQTELYEIGDWAIRARWPKNSWRNAWVAGCWRGVWRTHVRLRLLLTIRARLRTGHTEAAFASWRALTRATGGRMWGWIERSGDAWIRRSQAAPARDAEVRQSVSPL